MLNQIILIGRLTRDPDMRFTQNGTAVANFTLAVDRRFKNQAGEKETDFINCVAWNKTAEIAGKYLKKGNLASASGSLQIRKYQRQDGSNAVAAEVNIDQLCLLPNQKSENRDAPTEPDSPRDDDQDLPF